MITHHNNTNPNPNSHLLKPPALQQELWLFRPFASLPPGQFAPWLICPLACEPAKGRKSQTPFNNNAS